MADEFLSREEVTFDVDVGQSRLRGGVLIPLFRNYTNDGSDAGFLLSSAEVIYIGGAPSNPLSLSSYVELRWWFRYGYEYNSDTMTLLSYGEIKNAVAETPEFGTPIRVTPTTLLARNALFSYNAVLLIDSMPGRGARLQSQNQAEDIAIRRTELTALVADIKDALAAANASIG